MPQNLTLTISNHVSLWKRWSSIYHRYLLSSSTIPSVLLLMIFSLFSISTAKLLIFLSQEIEAGPNDVISPFKPNDTINKEICLPFRCFCSRKEIKCHDVVLEEMDIGKVISEYVSHSGIDTLVLGAASRNSFLRTFKPTDVPTVVAKSSPDFCTVYVISKGKVSSVKTASRAAPSIARPKIQMQNQEVVRAPETPETHFTRNTTPRAPQTPPIEQRSFQDELDAIRPPFGRAGGRGYADRSYGEISNPDTDISYVISGRPSTDRMFPSLYDCFDPVRTPPRLSNSSDMDSRRSFESLRMSGPRSIDLQSSSEFSMVSQDSKVSSSLSNMRCGIIGTGRWSSDCSSNASINCAMWDHTFDYRRSAFACSWVCRANSAYVHFHVQLY